MVLGLPFPTYLGWFVGPGLTVVTLVYCIWQYRKYLKNEEEKKNGKK